jgi:hypothetical protein
MRAEAGKLTLAVAPEMAGRETNTETLPNPAVLVETRVQSMSPRDVKPASIQMVTTGSCVTMFSTAVVVLVLSGHLFMVGLSEGGWEGVEEGVPDGLPVGRALIEGTAVGTFVGPAEGTEDGEAETHERQVRIHTQRVDKYMYGRRK